MHQILVNVPIVLAALLAGALLGASLASGLKRTASIVLIAAVSAIIAVALAYNHWGWQSLPVRGYGVMILLGFLAGVWLSARRAHLIGIEARHCVDVGIYGVFLGLAGARAFHVVMHWSEFDPFHGGGIGRVLDMFKVWEGGLVFYGAFVVVVPWAWLLCRHRKLPALPFLDLAAPGLIAGLALGRIGCFLNGCCFGKVSHAPWAMRFPQYSADMEHFTPPYSFQVQAGIIRGTEALSEPVHPTQLYASLAAALIAGFLYTYWPRRRFDGQVLSLMLLMAGVSRFFEEMLRTDEPAAFPAVSVSLTIAQWVAMGLVLVGSGMLFYFWKKPALTPLPA